MNMSPPSIRSTGFALLVSVAILLAFFGASVSAQTSSDVELNPQHPEKYIVKRGDTLWDISGLFLRNPWYWPEIWQVNPQVENPHLIFPGDVLTLVYIDGQPRIQLERGTAQSTTTTTTESGGTERLSPRIRVEDLDEAITTIPFELISAFLSKGTVLAKEEIEKLPYIAAIREGRLVAGAGNDVYVRGDVNGVNSGYSVVNVGEPLIDPEDRQIVGYKGNFVGEGVIRKVGDPSTLHLIDTQREALEGDRLISQEFEVPLQFIPRAPDEQVSGQILDVLDGVTIIGQYQVVILNRGARHGLNTGHVLTIWQAGRQSTDRFARGGSGEQIMLPEEEAGTLMIFKSYDRISYALIMEATTEIHVLDAVRNPQ